MLCYHFNVTYICLIALVSLITCSSIPSDPCYTAAVFEHNRVLLSSGLNSLKDTILVNLAIYEEAAQRAAENGAEIIVFPESGLFQSGDVASGEVLQVLPQVSDDTQRFPSPCLSYYNNQSDQFIIKQLSCSARVNGLFVSANIAEKVFCSLDSIKNCPPSGHFAYNTQVLFDDQGHLIAKYRKSHLFFESMFNTKPRPEVVAVNTRLGRLGMLICFDILFEQPLSNLVEEKQIDTLLFSAYWFDELPFLMAHQVQNGISKVRQINLLASGVSNVVNGATLGSGIYRYDGKWITYTHDINYSASKLLVARLPKRKQNNSSAHIECGRTSKVIYMNLDLNQPAIINSHHQKTYLGITPIKSTARTSKASYKPWKLDISLFNHVKLNFSSDQFQICRNNVCCRLTYSGMKKGNEDYYLLVHRWIRPTTKICEEFCGLVAYQKGEKPHYTYNSSTLFDFVQLHANFTTKHIIPSMITNELELATDSAYNLAIYSNAYRNNKKGQGYESVLTTQSGVKYNIVAFTLYSRCFGEDR